MCTTFFAKKLLWIKVCYNYFSYIDVFKNICDEFREYLMLLKNKLSRPLERVC